MATDPETSSKDAINAALHLFNRRWTLRILWELRERALLFRALQQACGDLSSSVLNTRLAELRDAQLVEHDPAAGYRLTAQGQALLVAFRPLLRWSRAWAQSLARPPARPAAKRAGVRTRSGRAS